MAFHSAGPSELIRCTQKDDQFISQLRGDLADILQKVIGTQNWLKWRKLIDTVADISYFTLTTLSGFQTLGEEYVNIVQVDATLRNVPSLMQRLASVLFHTTSPYLLRMALSRLNRLANNPTLNISGHQRNVLISFVDQCERAVPILQRFHTALFYFTGAFYNISKRTAGIRYILLRNFLVNQTFVRAYRLLGWLSLSQLMIALGLNIYTYSMKFPNESTQPKHSELIEVVKGSEKCSLCLGKRQQTTATPCGHLFCWICITEWMENKPQCPLCREQFKISRLVCLQNFT